MAQYPLRRRTDPRVPIYRQPWFWILSGTAVLIAWQRRRAALLEVPYIPRAAVAPPSSGQSLDPFRSTNLSDLQARAFTGALPTEGRKYGPLFVQVAAEKGVSPFLLAAIAEAETYYGAAERCGGKGPACVGVTDDRGLMQINPTAHPDFFARARIDGVEPWKIPIENIRYGADVWKASLATMQGDKNSSGKVTVSTKTAARLVVIPGKYPDPRPVEDVDLARFAATAGYNAGPMNAVYALAANRSPDALTYSGDYAKDVFKRMARIFNKTVQNLDGV